MNTRKVSGNQESRVAKAIKGLKTSNSGATQWKKGDVTTKEFLIECKTLMKEQQSISIKKEWIEKNKKEALAMRKPYQAIAFDFGDGKTNYIINETLFKFLVNALEKEN